MITLAQIVGLEEVVVIKIEVWKVFFILLFLELLLVVADVTLNYWEWIGSRPARRIFNITREDALANWFSSLQLLLVSILLFFAGHLQCFKTNLSKCYWRICAAFFFYLALDDAAKIHERVGSSLGEMYYNNQDTYVGQLLKLFPSYDWQIIFIPIFALFGGFIFWFLFCNMKQFEMRGLLFLGFSCYAISQGLDFLEGVDVVVSSLVSQWEITEYTVRHFFKLIEEFLEMFGTSCLIISLLLYVKGSLLESDRKVEVLIA